MVVNLYAIDNEKAGSEQFHSSFSATQRLRLFFLAPCPTSGQVIYSENDELVSKERIVELDNRIKSQKGVEVIFSKIKNSNHFFKDKEKELVMEIEKYLKEKTALI